jgi:hypothetical protein
MKIAIDNISTCETQILILNLFHLVNQKLPTYNQTLVFKIYREFLVLIGFLIFLGLGLAGEAHVNLNQTGLQVSVLNENFLTIK